MNVPNMMIAPFVEKIKNTCHDKELISFKTTGNELMQNGYPASVPIIMIGKNTYITISDSSTETAFQVEGEYWYGKDLKLTEI